jgi:glycosyltransferase involved in cell wall biosynthesis
LVEQYRSEIEFLGLRNDVPAVLAESDIFVMPSYSEGLSNAVMEAMASGCAIIATAVGGTPYLVENGVSGLLFEPGDRAALQAHIRRLVEDPAKRTAMGKAARAKAERELSWEVVGRRYAALFGED